MVGLGVLVGLGGCASQNRDEPLGERPVRVVTTTTMITDAVTIVGGEHVEVHGLMGAGVDPHQYEEKPGDISRMQRADVIFYNGLHLEGKMADVFAQMRGRIKTVAVAEVLPKEQLRAVPGFEGGFDPHVWFDVTLWIKVVEHIRDTLVALDGTHADTYRTNAAKHITELTELHDYVKKQAERLSPPQRVLATAHDAFGYFGRAYGFEVHGLQGVSTEAEASISDVQKLAAFLVERRIPALFVESSVPTKTIEAVQKAVQARDFHVVIGGELYSDALGSPDTPEGSYVGMVRHNIDTIVKALMQGR